MNTLYKLNLLELASNDKVVKIKLQPLTLSFFYGSETTCYRLFEATRWKIPLDDVRINFGGEHLVILVTSARVKASIVGCPLNVIFVLHKHTNCGWQLLNCSSIMFEANRMKRESQISSSTCVVENMYGATFPLIFVVYIALLKFMSAVTTEKHAELFFCLFN